MSDRDFELGGRKFKLSKMDAFKQFKVVRKIAPILGEIFPAAQKFSKAETGDQDQMLMVTAIMNGMSKLSDADADSVLLSLCSCVEVQQMPIGNWARVSNDSMLIMQDLELPILLQIAGKAFMYNLSGFFLALPASPGAK